MSMKTMPGAALKALDDTGRVGGYLVVWGSAAEKDLQGEYFTPATDLQLEMFEKRPLLYHHGMDARLKTAKLGDILTMTEDETGAWIEAQLDLRKSYVQAVWKLIKKGALGLSSGSLPHMVEVKADGEITRWPIIEGSATPSPAEPRTTLDAIKALLDLEAGDASDAGRREPTPEAIVSAMVAAVKGDFAGGEAVTTAPANGTSPQGNEAKTMNELLDQVMAALADAGIILTDEQKQAVISRVQGMGAGTEGAPATMSADVQTQIKSWLANPTGEMPAALKSLSELIARTASEVRGENKAALNAAFKGLLAQGQSRVGSGSGASNRPAAFNPQVRVASKYDPLSAEDMAFVHQVVTSPDAANKHMRRTLPPEFYQAMAAKTEREQVAIPTAALKSWQGIKANEFDTSTQVGFGDEWVPEIWESSLWERQRIDNPIATSLTPVNMTGDPFNVPSEGADPTVYRVPETSDETQMTLATSASPIPESKVATGKVQLVSKKLALRVGYSAELDEDSIVPFASQLNKQAKRALLDAIDSVILNGDTVLSANTNINLIDGTPTTSDKYTVFDGMRKLPLVTNTTLATDMLGAALTLAAIRQAKFKMLGAYALRPTDLRIVVGAAVYAKLLGLSEFITMDKAGNLATAQTGQVGYIDGTPVLTSNEYGLANATGKISVTPSNNTLGSLLIYAPYAWKHGYRRQAKLVTEYLSYYDEYQLTGTVRIALGRIDSVCAAILYNFIA